MELVGGRLLKEQCPWRAEKYCARGSHACSRVYLPFWSAYAVGAARTQNEPEQTAVENSFSGGCPDLWILSQWFMKANILQAVLGVICAVLCIHSDALPAWCGNAYYQTNENISPSVLNRLMKEVKEYTKNPVSDIVLQVNEANVTDIRADLHGPGRC